MQEIGSEYWVDEIADIHDDITPHWIKSWENVVLTASGRGAISLLLEEIEEVITYRTILLPSYICESVINPFVKKGYTCYFYDINPNMEPNMDSLNQMLNKDIGIFLHMGYYGFPTSNSLGSQIRALKGKAIIIIEDITHSLFSNYERYIENDYYIASIRKWMGLPSGGLLASRIHKFKVNLNLDMHFSELRKDALRLKAQYIKSPNNDLKSVFLKMFSEAESILDHDSGAYCIDKNSIAILNELNIKELIDKRKSNFNCLLETLSKINGLELTFKELPKGICPFFFPIYIKSDRNQFRAELVSQGIYCPIHWPIPEQVELEYFVASQFIYNNIISLPCDQRYSIEDMKRMSCSIKEVIENKYLANE